MCRTDLAAICKARDDNAGMLLSLLAQLCATLINLLRIFKPETVIGWHRELVRRKWKQKPVDPGGRPPLSQELSDLIIQLAKENTRWGYGKIAGELLKLGFDVSESTGG